jgi:hypothetical protein
MNQYFYRAYVKFMHGSSRVLNSEINSEPGRIVYDIHCSIDKQYAHYCKESGDSIKYIDITHVSKVN